MRTNRSSKRCSEFTLASLVALAVCGPAAAQDDALAERVRQDEHRLVLQGERVSRLLERLARADAPTRELVVASLEAARPQDASVHWTPGLDLLRRAEGLLDPVAEEVDPQWEALDRLAGSLDLIAAPGAFEVRAGELTEPLIVHVVRAWGSESANVDLALEWLDPSGERSAARREPVAAEAFGPSGFPMYLRAPGGGAGRRQLFGHISRRPGGKFAALVPGIRVDAVENLRARLEALRARERIEQPGYRRLEALLSRLLVAGQRGSTALGGGEMLLALERWTSDGPPRGLLVPLERSSEGTRGPEQWLWSYSPQREPERALAFIAHSGETAEQVFSGELGDAWLEYAERSGTQLLATHAPNSVAQLAPLLARLREWTGRLELVLVTRGDSLAALGIAGVNAGEPPFDAWVAFTSVPAANCAALFPGSPSLVIAPGPAAPARAGLEWIEGDRLWFLGEPSLLAHVSSWLERRAQSR